MKAKTAAVLPNTRFNSLALGGSLSGILLALAYPAFSLSPLAWVAFLPLLSDLYRAKTFRQAALASGAAGLVFFLLSCYWISHVSGVGYVLLCLYLCLFFIPFGLAVHAFYRDGKSMILWGSVAWVALEFVRGSLFGGFPWNTLASSQARTLPLIQMASVTGAYGVTFVVILANFMLFEFWMWMRRKALKTSLILIPAGIVLLLVVVDFGYRELRNAERLPAAQREPVKLAAVQPYIPQNQKWDPAYYPMIMRRLKALTLEAAESKPAMIVWPETSVPGELRNEKHAKTFVQALAKEAGVPLLVGTQDSVGNPPLYYNGAALVDPDKGILTVHHKLHLVPYGEYLPGARWIPFFRWFIPIPEDFSPGKEKTIFSLRGPTLRWQEPDGTVRSETRMVRFGVVICFEDAFSELFRSYCENNQLDFMVNMTNDAWFQNSGASVQHANLAVFRAVENRMPLLRATNTGYTCLIDPYGRITADIRKDGSIFVPGSLVADVSPLRVKTPFNKLGDFFAHACLILALVKAYMIWRDRLRNPK